MKTATPWATILGTVLSAGTTAVLTAVGLFLAKWKLGELSRKELQAALADQRMQSEEYRKLVAEADRRCDSLKGEVETARLLAGRNAERISGLEEQIVYLHGERLRRDRYITLLGRCLREAKLDIPPFEEEKPL